MLGRDPLHGRSAHAPSVTIETTRDERLAASFVFGDWHGHFVRVILAS